MIYSLVVKELLNILLLCDFNIDIFLSWRRCLLSSPQRECLTFFKACWRCHWAWTKIRYNNPWWILSINLLQLFAWFFAVWCDHVLCADFISLILFNKDIFLLAILLLPLVNIRNNIAFIAFLVIRAVYWWLLVNFRLAWVIVEYVMTS